MTSFLVQVREVDGVTFTTEYVYCTEDDATVLSSQSCSIPISVLTSAPYELPYGSSIVVRVTATNAYGASDYKEGSGAIILTVPTAPLVADYAVETTSNQITIAWPAAQENGGTPILDYSISYA